MAERTQVVVYGSSISMAGIAASLTARTGLEVVCVAPVSSNSWQRLYELHPAVIIFDLCNPSPDLDITLLRAQPDLLLIGVDPSSDEVLMLSSRAAKALSMADLVDVIAIAVCYGTRKITPM